MEDNKQYHFEDIKSSSNYWEEVFRTLANSLTRAQPYRSPARHLGMTNRVSPLRRATPSPLRSTGGGGGGGVRVKESLRDPSPAIHVRRPISITPTRPTTSSGKYTNIKTAHITPLQVPISKSSNLSAVSVSTTVPETTSAILSQKEETIATEYDKEDNTTTAITDEMVSMETAPTQWQLPSDLLLPETSVIESDEVLALPIESSFPPYSEPVSETPQSLTVSTSLTNTLSTAVCNTDAVRPSNNNNIRFSLYNAVYYSSFVVLLITVGVFNGLNAIYSSSTASTTTTAIPSVSTVVDNFPATIHPSEAGEYIKSSTYICPVSDVLTVLENPVCDAEQSDFIPAVVGALGFSVNRYSCFRLTERR
jgi:hypothetical protein